MFGRWFKKPAAGPDFSGVDSLAKAQALHERGELEKLLLMPREFGGDDIPQNVVYVPVGLSAQKQRIDREVIGPLAQAGKVTNYAAEPRYQGRSFIPIAIELVASSAQAPEAFRATIAIWGDALKR